MTARATFFASASDLPAIQAIVKRHDMRFVSNPAAWIGKLDRLSVTVSAENMASFNAGCAALWAITDTKQPEPQKKAWWRRILSGMSIA